MSIHDRFRAAYPAMDVDALFEMEDRELGDCFSTCRIIYGFSKDSRTHRPAARAATIEAILDMRAKFRGMSDKERGAIVVDEDRHS